MAYCSGCANHEKEIAALKQLLGEAEEAFSQTPLNIYPKCSGPNTNIYYQCQNCWESGDKQDEIKHKPFCYAGLIQALRPRIRTAITDPGGK